MEGMEIIPNLFEDIAWGPLLTVTESYYPKMVYEIYANLHKGRVQKMLNTILGILENGIRFYTKNKKCFDPNLYRERGFEELFTKGEVLKRHDGRNEGMLVRGGQDDNDESDEDDEENKEEEAMNVDEDESEEEPEEETFRREMRQKKRQERKQEEEKKTDEALKKAKQKGSFRLFRKKNKRCTKGVSKVIYKEAKDHSRLQNFMKMKWSS
ncbi:hypothetical protein M9H77_16436 [Catharanthus roseus]|uniref:Uncharacterized protein n=1 Tax=Catharanthus roseus TaxID=4058 RepID=A0ACC0B1S2_CATRO|nr:hypothetical protein M9H77_16436 [Catharanthus roseus]